MGQDDVFDDCPEDVWADEEAGILLDITAVEDRGCPACLHEWEIWEKIIEDAGHPSYGRIAFEMLQLHSDIEMYPDVADTLSAAQWEFLRYTRQAMSMADASRAYNANKTAQQQSHGPRIRDDDE